MWCGNTNITIPYFTSDKGYGLYWDNAGDSRFTDIDNIASFTSEVAPSIDYYFIYRDGTQDGVIAGIRSLTGEATMFPIWTRRSRRRSVRKRNDRRGNAENNFRHTQKGYNLA